MEAISFPIWVRFGDFYLVLASERHVLLVLFYFSFSFI